jgi:hypothetical protein
MKDRIKTVNGLPRLPIKEEREILILSKKLERWMNRNDNRPIPRHASECIQQAFYSLDSAYNEMVPPCER